MTTDQKIKEPEGFDDDQISDEVEDVLEQSRRHQMSVDQDEDYNDEVWDDGQL